ncbi:MAG: helix-turn-helix domain-containing protein, partial [Xanthobacteraceae bacterium]
MPTSNKADRLAEPTTSEPPHGVTAISEAKAPKDETTPQLGMKSRKRGRRRGQQLSPERMQIVLDSLRKNPVLSHAARTAGIHPKTLAYWIKRSEAGDAGYDVVSEG